MFRGTRKSRHSVPLIPCTCNDCQQHSTYPASDGTQHPGMLWTSEALLKHRANLLVGGISVPNSGVIQPCAPEAARLGDLPYQARDEHASVPDIHSCAQTTSISFAETNSGSRGSADAHINVEDNCIRSPLQLESVDKLVQVPGGVKQSIDIDSSRTALLEGPPLVEDQSDNVQAENVFKTDSLHHRWFSLLSHSPVAIASTLSAACQYLLHHASIPTVNLTLQITRAINTLAFGPPTRLNSIPLTIRTVLKNFNLLPHVQRRICCSECYSMYPLDTSLLRCVYRGTRRSKICDAPLFVDLGRRLCSKSVPRRFYTTYSLLEWLGRFLNRPGIEDLLDTSLQIDKPAIGLMSDVWDSPMWKKQKNLDGSPFTSKTGHLAFALGVDWFNPWGNKAAGKVASLGAIVLVCLNLPLSHRYRPENIFIAGITPGPAEPKVLQIGNVLTPLVEELLKLWQGVKLSSTSRQPTDGRVIRAMILQVICDLPAIRKVMGFAGHSSKKHVCSFCKIHKDDLEKLESTEMDRRTNNGVRHAASQWRAADTWTRRNQIFAEHGVRDSPLLDLPYLLPISHVVVEPMHNIFLGILKFHGQTLFGFKCPREKAIRKEDVQDEDDDSNVNESHATPPVALSDFLEEEDDLGTELKELFGISTLDLDAYLDAKSNYAERSPRRASHSFDGDEESDEDSDLDYCASGLWSDSGSDKNPSDCEESEADDDNDDPNLIFNDPVNMELLRLVISTIQLPSWIGRVPNTVGLACGGKLKADKWVVLFTVILIPVVGNILTQKKSTRSQLLFNFFHLISAANLVRQSEVNIKDINLLKRHLQNYRHGMSELFPSVKPRPNHHMVLHVPECMARFGPASLWTGWVYERINGDLRAIPTNRHMYALDLTLLRTFITAANLRAALPVLCETLPNELKRPILAFLRPSNTSGTHSQLMHEFTQTSELLWSEKKGKELAEGSHARLVLRLRNVEKLAVHFSKTLKTRKRHVGEIVVPRWVNFLASFQHRGVTFSTSGQHMGNSVIKYRALDARSEALAHGTIQSIFIIKYNSAPGHLITEMWLEVQRFPVLSSSDKSKNPYADWPHLKTDLAYMYNSGSKKTPRLDIVRPSDVLGHVALWHAPAGTFGIPLSTVVLVELSKSSLSAI